VRPIRVEESGEGEGRSWIQWWPQQHKCVRKSEAGGGPRRGLGHLEQTRLSKFVTDTWVGVMYLLMLPPTLHSHSLMIGVRAEFCECDPCWSLAHRHVVGMAWCPCPCSPWLLVFVVVVVVVVCAFAFPIQFFVLQNP
jgi:hypothetical protein